MAGEEELERLRTAVAADEALQRELGGVVDASAFARRASEAAAGLGIDLDESELADRVKPDPLGLGRLASVRPSPSWAPSGWLPVDLFGSPAGPVVDWAHFSGEPLRAPFFADDARAATARPFNRLLRWQTPLADFVRAAVPVRPDGFVFHLSRCGSTLVSQMLSALPGAVCVSEAQPLDIAVRIGDPDLLRAMIAALGRARTGGPFFVKLNFWHALALPLFRHAFPDVPWVLVHRDPVEILVSQMRITGPEMQPHFAPPQLQDIEDNGDEAEHYAQVLARVARAAIGALPDGGLAVDYRALPEAVCERILPHFGLSCGPAERSALAGAAGRDVKRRGRTFSPDSEDKKQAASPEVLAAAERHLWGLFETLGAQG